MKNSKKYIVVCSYLEGTIKEALEFSNWDIDGSTLICADGGLNLVLEEGYYADYLIGDLDSFNKERLNCAMEANPDMEIIKLPAEKDHTDTAVAVDFAIKHGCEDVLIIGGMGGRIDHTFAIIQTLASLIDLGSEDHFNAYLGNGRNLVFITNDKQINLPKTKGKYFSIFSYGERLKGVTIKNAKYNLDNYNLKNTYPIGVSNEIISDEPVMIEKEEGLALVVISKD